MLTVYTYPIEKPTNCFDLSTLPLDELCDSALSIHEHQVGVKIYLGYLDGWMLNPREEVILRRILRDFECIVVSHFPLAFSHAWKNEIIQIYSNEPNASSNINNNGSSIQYGSSNGHQQISTQSSINEQDNQNRETGSVKKRRVQKRQDKKKSET